MHMMKVGYGCHYSYSLPYDEVVEGEFYITDMKEGMTSLDFKAHLLAALEEVISKQGEFNISTDLLKGDFTGSVWVEDVGMVKLFWYDEEELYEYKSIHLTIEPVLLVQEKMYQLIPFTKD